MLVENLQSTDLSFSISHKARRREARAYIIRARRGDASCSFYPADPRRALSAITARLLLFRQVKSVGCRYSVMTVLEVVSRLSAEKSRLVDRTSKPRLVSAARNAVTTYYGNIIWTETGIHRRGEASRADVYRGRMMRTHRPGFLGLL